MKVWIEIVDTEGEVVDEVVATLPLVSLPVGDTVGFVVRGRSGIRDTDGEIYWQPPGGRLRIGFSERALP